MCRVGVGLWPRELVYIVSLDVVTKASGHATAKLA